LLNLTFDDFSRAIYLHQESIRGLLTDDISARDAAIDRLLGLNDMRNIIDCIPIKKIKDATKKLQAEKDRTDSQIIGATKQVEGDLKKAERALVDFDISKEDATFQNACKIIKKLIDSITETSSKYKIEGTDVIAPSELEDIPKTLRKIKQTIDSFRKSIIDDSKIEPLRTRINELSKLKQDFADNEKKLNDSNRGIIETEKEYGKKEEMEKSFKDNEKGIISLKAKRKELDANSRVVEDAIDYLIETKSKKCPVCKNNIEAEKIIMSLKSQSNSNQNKLFEDIDEKITRLESDNRNLKKILPYLESLYSDLEEINKERKSLISDLSTILDKNIDKLDITPTITESVGTLKKRIAQLEMPFKEQEDKFQKIEGDMEKIKAIEKVLERNEEHKKITERFSDEHKESSDLRNKIEELSVLEENFVNVIKAINNVQMNLAKEMINVSKNDIDSFYKTMCNHPYYSCLSINVKPRKVGGNIKNSYEIIVSGKDGSNITPAVSKLSEGQMNSLAISVYLSLSKVFFHNLGFLILDDPSQSLDNEHKRALIEIIKSLTNEKQIFISTQDESFQDLLKENIKHAKSQIFNFGDWTSKNGPSIEEASV